MPGSHPRASQSPKAKVKSDQNEPTHTSSPTLLHLAQTPRSGSSLRVSARCASVHVVRLLEDRGGAPGLLTNSAKASCQMQGAVMCWMTRLCKGGGEVGKHGNGKEGEDVPQRHVREVGGV